MFSRCAASQILNDAMTTVAVADPQAFLRELFDVAVAAVHPAICVPPHLPPPPKGRTVVIGAGKAAAAMAAAVEEHWPAAAL